MSISIQAIKQTFANFEKKKKKILDRFMCAKTHFFSNNNEPNWHIFSFFNFNCLLNMNSMVLTISILERFVQVFLFLMMYNFLSTIHWIQVDLLSFVFTLKMLKQMLSNTYMPCSWEGLYDKFAFMCSNSHFMSNAGIHVCRSTNITCNYLLAPQSNQVWTCFKCSSIIGSCFHL